MRSIGGGITMNNHRPVDPKQINIAAQEGLLFGGRYLPYNPSLLEHARELRKHATKEECMLWKYLKTLPVRVLRQRPIGNYIVDFYIPEKRIAIEIDGGQHYSNTGKQYDEKRTAFMNEFGIRVLRFSNTEVKQQYEQVCVHIWRLLEL